MGPRVHIGLAHRDNLFLELHFHARKRLARGGAFLPLQRGTAGQRTDIAKDGIKPRTVARDCPIDPLTRNQKRAGNPVFAADVLQRPLHRGGVFKRGKMIECSKYKHSLGLAGNRGFGKMFTLEFAPMHPYPLSQDKPQRSPPCPPIQPSS